MPERDAPEHRDPAICALAQHFAETALPRLRAIARRSGARPGQVDDVVQQALYAFLRSYRGDPADTGGAYAYLARAVQTSVLHALRDERRHTRRVASAMSAAGADVGSDPLDLALATAELEQARELLAGVPAEERIVVFLGAAGYRHEEIAERCGISARRVRKLVGRANARLREPDPG